MNSPNNSFALLSSQNEIELHRTDIHSVADLFSVTDLYIRAGKCDQAKKILEEGNKNLNSITDLIKWYYYLSRCQSSEEHVPESIKILKLALGHVERYSKILNTNSYLLSIENALKHIIKANIAFLEDNWGIAESELREVIHVEEIDLDIQINSYEKIGDLNFRKWLSSPTEHNLIVLNKSLEIWEEFSRKNDFFVSLCDLYYIRSKIASALFQFEEAKKWLMDSKRIAKKYGLSIHVEFAQDEINKINTHIRQILNYSNLESDLSTGEDQLKGYLKKISLLFR
ncbi:MAG: hypothetical protein ACXAC7_06260 [Candidatus Hodarchaeales archaeon]|jgi:tetratricopeptide (TPR) repeat protein